MRRAPGHHDARLRPQSGWVGTLFAVVLGAVVTAGCGQILGVDEYSIDPTNGASRCDALHAPDTTGIGCTTTVVGVPASACANGFTSDGNGGCFDGLPPTECTDGTIATPGQPCGEISSCFDSYYSLVANEPAPDGGTGPGFPAAQTLYVNGVSPAAGDGSKATPFQTIGQAITAAGQNAMVILVAPGTYTEALTITAPLSIVGTGPGGGTQCPHYVAIQAPDSTAPAVRVSGRGANGAGFGFLQIVGGSPGLEIDGTEFVLLNVVRISDTSGPGLVINGDSGEGGSARIPNRLLVDHAVGAGIEVYGSKLDAPGGLVVRDTQPLGDGREGYGIALHPDPIGSSTVGPDKATPSELTLSGAVLEGNAGAGLFVEGSDATVTDTIIRNTHANGLGEGRGVVVQRRPLGPVTASLMLTGSIVEQSHDVGVLVIDSPAPLNGSPGVTATITNTTIRDVGNDATDAGGGATACTGTGLRVRSDGFWTASDTERVVLQNSLIDGAREEGIHVLGARVDVRQSIVSGTTGCGGFGDGIAAYADQVMATKVNVTQSKVEASARAGIAAFGAGVTVTSSVVDGCGTVPIAKVERGGVPATVQVTEGGCGCKSVNAACNAETPTVTPTPSLIGGNGCEAFPGGVCLSGRWEDTYKRLSATSDPLQPTSPLPNLVVWAPDDLTIAPAQSDSTGRYEWGGLPAGGALVAASGREGYMPFIWRAGISAHSMNVGLESLADNATVWSVDVQAASQATPSALVDARTTPTLSVLVIDASEQTDIAKGADVLLNHGLDGVTLEVVSGSVLPPTATYVDSGDALDPSATTMSKAGVGTFFNAAPDDVVVRLVRPAGSANIHCASPWDDTPAKGWTVNNFVAPDTVRILTRPGFNSTMYALCSVE